MTTKRKNLKSKLLFVFIATVALCATLAISVSAESSPYIPFGSSDLNMTTYFTLESDGGGVPFVVAYSYLNNLNARERGVYFTYPFELLYLDNDTITSLISYDNEENYKIISNYLWNSNVYFYSNQTSTRHTIKSLCTAYSITYDNFENLIYNQYGFYFNNYFNQGAYSDGYLKGFDDGMSEANMLEIGLNSIFSAPSYALYSIFNFDIFGINVLSILLMVLSIILIAWLIKRFV